MPAGERNLFEDVLRSEDSVTELLRNLLQSKPLRQAFLSLFLEPKEAEEVGFDQITTQKPLAGSDGRPDLSIEGHGFWLLIEVKTQPWTQLTANQPGGYLQALEADPSRTGLLGFIIPSPYFHESELNRRLAEWLFSKKGTRKVPIVKWTEVLNAFKSVDASEPNHVDRFRVEFCNYVESHFCLPEIRFQSDEVRMIASREIPNKVRTLFSLVDSAEGAVQAAGWRTSRGGKREQDYGFYVEDKIFFGVWWTFWEAYQAPLCLAVVPGHAELSDALRKRHENAKEYRDGERDPDHMVWSIPLPGDDNEEYTEKVVTLVKDELSALSGSLRSPATAD